jgi:hypothetical protein
MGLQKVADAGGSSGSEYDSHRYVLQHISVPFILRGHARDVYLLHGLLMVGLRTVGRDALEAVDCLAIHGTHVRRPRITDTPPLTLQQLFHGRFWQLAPRHQGALPLGELPVVQGAAQPFDVPGLAGPGAMRAIAGAGTIALCTVGMRAREASIAFLR